MNIYTLKKPKVSIVIPILNSHKVVKRQLRHFKSMDLSNNVEIVLIDDGSDPPLKDFYDPTNVRNCKIYPTGDTRPWTQACAKNMGAEIAQGEYLFITDIDSIIPKNAITMVEQFCGDKMEFFREIAVLNRRGQIQQDLKTVLDYGYPKKKYQKHKFKTYKHTNTFAMRKSVFEMLGGYDAARCDKGTHPTHDDLYLHSQYRSYARAGKCLPSVMGPVVYMFPSTGVNVKNLFHDLKR